MRPSETGNTVSWSVSEPQTENAVHQKPASQKNPVKVSDIAPVAGSPSGRNHQSMPARRDGESHSFDLRMMGADLVAEDQKSSDIIHSKCFTLDPRRYTPKDGYHLGKTVPFYDCRDTILSKPSRFLLVSLPGFGTKAGGRHSSATLRNIGELVTAHLLDPSHRVDRWGDGKSSLEARVRQAPVQPFTFGTQNRILLVLGGSD